MKRFFLSFCLLLITVSHVLLAKDDVAICAIFQNEAPYLVEWIEFHKLQGVKHFYLYNNNSEDNYLEVLQPYIDQNLVTLNDWLFTYEYSDHTRWIAIQTGAYKDCIKNYGDQMEWLAAIDVDEFLYTVKGKKLGDFLKAYRQFGGLGVNWVKFGTNNVEDFTPGKLLIQELTRCGRYRETQNQFMKAIAQPKYVADCTSPHCFRYIPGKFAVNADKQKVSGPRSDVIHLRDIRINHYWTRTKKYLFEEKIPSRQKRRDAWTTERILQMCDELNAQEDKTILQYVAPLRKQMGLPAMAQ